MGIHSQVSDARGCYCCWEKISSSSSSSSSYGALHASAKLRLFFWSAPFSEREAEGGLGEKITTLLYGEIFEKKDDEESLLPPPGLCDTGVPKGALRVLFPPLFANL